MPGRSWSELFAPTLGYAFLYFDALFVLIAAVRELGTYGSRQIPLALLLATPLVIAVIAIPSVVLSLTVSKWISRWLIGTGGRIALIALPILVYGVCWYLLAINER